MPRKRWTTDPQYDFLLTKMNTYLQKKVEAETNVSALTTLYNQVSQEFLVKWPNTPNAYRRISAWYPNTARSLTQEKESPQTRTIGAGRKLLPVKQAYMEMFYKEFIKPVVDDRYLEHCQSLAPGETAKNRMSIMHAVTKEMYDDESDEVKKKVEEYRQSRFHGTLYDDDPEARNGAYNSALAKIPKQLSKEAEMIAKQTGCNVVMWLGGPNPSYEGQLHNVLKTYGRTKDGLSFKKYLGEDRYRTWIGELQDWLSESYDDVDCASRSLNASYEIPTNHDGELEKAQGFGSEDQKYSDSESAEDDDDDLERIEGAAGDTQGPNSELESTPLVSSVPAAVSTYADSSSTISSQQDAIVANDNGGSDDNPLCSQTDQDKEHSLSPLDTRALNDETITSDVLSETQNTTGGVTEGIDEAVLSIAPADLLSMAMPKFLKDHATWPYLCEKVSLSANWMRLLDAYIRFEMSNPQQGNLSTTHRPSPVLSWMKGTVRNRRLIPTVNVAKYGPEMLRWWKFLQPIWRVHESEPPYITTSFSREDGTWGDLCRGGSSGIYTVVMAVSWWIGKCDADDIPVELAALIDDMTWVIDEMSKSLLATQPAAPLITPTPNSLKRSRRIPPIGEPRGKRAKV